MKQYRSINTRKNPRRISDTHDSNAWFWEHLHGLWLFFFLFWTPTNYRHEKEEKLSWEFRSKTPDDVSFILFPICKIFIPNQLLWGRKRSAWEAKGGEGLCSAIAWRSIPGLLLAKQMPQKTTKKCSFKRKYWRWVPILCKQWWHSSSAKAGTCSNTKDDWGWRLNPPPLGFNVCRQHCVHASTAETAVDDRRTW